ncbi:hypothetical protein DSECCO2_492740 [anaerobic digester metagenome]
MAKIIPPGLRTRFHSRTALAGSWSVQRRYLFTTRSKEQSSNGRFSASPWNKEISRPILSALCLAFSSMPSDRSIPETSCPISAKRRARKPVPVPTSSTFKRLPEAREFSKICFQTARSSSSNPFIPFL